MTDNPYRYPYVPVGGIIEWDGTGLTGAPDLSTPEKVAAVYGYGTWERYGTDRVTVGAGGDYMAGSVGGEKEHTLTADELPEITGSFGFQSRGNTQGLVNEVNGVFSIGQFSDAGFKPNNADPGDNCGRSIQMSFGKGNSHNNMQPYIATYRYRRIA